MKAREIEISQPQIEPVKWLNLLTGISTSRNKPGYTLAVAGLLLMSYLIVLCLCPLSSQAAGHSKHHSKLVKGQHYHHRLRHKHRAGSQNLRKAASKLKQAKAVQASGSDYIQQTSSLYRAYQLRDRALNEYLLGDYGLSAQHMSESARLSGGYWGRPQAAEGNDYFDLGLAAQAAGQNSLAKDAFFQCLQRQSLPAVYEQLSMLYMKEGDFNQAQAYANKLVDATPDYAGGHLLLSVLAERTGRLDMQSDELRKLEQILQLPADSIQSSLEPDSLNTVP